MATAATIEKQLTEFGEFVNAHRKIVGITDDQLSNSVSGLVRSISAQIRTMQHMELKDATRLNTVLAGIVDIPDRDRGELASAIARQHMAVMNGFGSGGSAKLQTLQSPLKLWTRTDWDYFLDKKNSEDAIIHRACDRLQGLGLVHPHETPTCKVLAALLTAAVYHNIGTPVPTDTLRIVGKLKCGLAKARRLVAEGIVFPIMYPDDPSGLPQSVYTNTYSVDDPPIDTPITTYMQVLRITKVRREKVSQNMGMTMQQGNFLGGLIHALSKSSIDGGRDAGDKGSLLSGLVDLRNKGTSVEHALQPQCQSPTQPSAESNVPFLLQHFMQNQHATAGFMSPMGQKQHSLMHGLHHQDSFQSSESPPSDAAASQVVPYRGASSAASATVGHVHADMHHRIHASIDEPKPPATVTAKPTPKKTIAELEALARGAPKHSGCVPHQQVRRRISKKQPPHAAASRGTCTGRGGGRGTGRGKGASKGASAGGSKTGSKKGASKGSGKGSGKVGVVDIMVRPPIPNEATYDSKRIKYMTGGILISKASEAYRVFLRGGDKVDRKVYWKLFASKADAWASACEKIEAAHA
jgi:hypothetical protein